MDKNIYKICVENVNLTVGYYREYFGFKLIESTREKLYMNSAIMNFHDNILHFEKAEKAKKIINQEIVFKLGFNSIQLKELYDKYKHKTKIKTIVSNDIDQVSKFSIKDCDNNIISFLSTQKN